jgi:nicotinamidase-related amidase
VVGGMTIDPRRVAVLGLHWQVNVIEAEGFFGGMLAEPVRRSGVVARSARFHAAMRGADLPVYFTRFTIPTGGGRLVRNTGFMEAVAEAQELFRPDAAGASLVEAMRPLTEPARVIDNQKLSGLAGNDLPDLLAERGVDTVFLTGVATNLTVEQTARHGTDLGLTVYVVSDCVAAVSDEVHQASLANLALTTRGLITATEAVAAVGAA